MTRRLFLLLTILSLMFTVCVPAAFGDALPEENPEDYGLVPSDGIEIPAFTEASMKKYDFPQITPGIEFVRKLKAGWNLGNTFDARDEGPGDPRRDYETYWSGAKTSRELIHAVAQAGFNLIRIPVSWHNHLTDDDYTIDPAWIARVEEVVGWALAEDMYVILNIHHDNEKGYLYPDSAHYEQSEKYITAIWTQVAERFAGCDEHLIFEAMNEPRLAGTEYEWQQNPDIPEVRGAMECINRLNRIFVDTVRASGGYNPDRFLMIPGYCGGVGSVCADAFELPADDRLIIMVHAYTPYDFALNMNSPDSHFDLKTDSRKKSEIAAVMNALYERYIRHGTPVIIDEFGALYKKEGELQSRVNYAAFFTATASARGIPVVWWDNAGFSGNGEKFGLIDRKRIEWVYPDIALAIVRNCRVNREE